MTSSILKSFAEQGVLIDKELLHFIHELNNEVIARDILSTLVTISKKKLITKQLLTEHIEKIKPLLDGENKKILEKYFVRMHISFEVEKETIIESLPPPVKIISSPLVASKKLEVKDFIKHFKSRYVALRAILQERPELKNVISIDKISGNREFSIIGFVSGKRVTKNKNVILEVEDLTGKATLLINHTKEEVFEKSKEILLDDVLGFKCAGSKDFLFVNDIFYPDCFVSEKKRTQEDVYALFISDIHVGSKNFLEKNFTRFIEWLGGIGADEKQKEVLKKIKYLFVVGDTVDGVGVYPGQEKELLVKDIERQYELLADFYRKIPGSIQIIQCAGQHDAVRVAEPQPPVGEDFAAALHTLPNLHLVSNPSFIEIERGNCVINGKKIYDGIKILMYHGASMHPIINEIESLRLSNAHATPAHVIKHLLLRRHLAPMHGDVLYIPHDEDPLVIRETPDIITTGDLHRTDIDSYNNVLIIANSCWQSMTAFEEKVGNKPDPCKVPVLNLKTRALTLLDFSDEEEHDG